MNVTALFSLVIKVMRVPVIVTVLVAVIATPAMASEPLQSEEYAIGVMVKSLDNAIQHPSADALELISQYGTDSRYYVMIRGWLVQELQGANSQLAANRKEDMHKAKLQQRVDFLQQAIRRIDLE